ncbi:hypothetical protein [Thermoactinospora rubra]|uniref:hypothetical protein n=1 Tax=Thermoactinospora rubra TaxID=1088767 RepID=UPI000A118E2E|nr:hypothetical protein [Thermoactinospora rubra]
MDLDEVADRLYALPPGEFTAARDAEARAAKEAGDVRLAREIGRLRKPTVSAWAVNRAAREHPGELAELVRLGEELRAAWERHDADALAALTQRRGTVTGRLSRLIRDRAGLSAAAAAEVDQTLDAAVVDAEAAEQVRRGRLAKPLSYSGFAPAPVPRQRPPRRARPSQEEAGQAEERRARARREAQADLEQWRERLGQAERERQDRAGRVAELERELAQAKRELAEAGQRLEVARREERNARRRLEAL